MRRLLDFIFKYRNFLLFVGLELLCFWLLFSYNQRYNTYFFNSSNGTVADLSNTSNNISEYFHLTDVNIQLMKENFELKEELANIKRSLREQALPDTISSKYRVVGAKVISNTTKYSQNFITIAVGKKHGIQPEMGVVSFNGVVGKVKAVSENYATVYSVLNTRLLVPGTLKKTSTNCTVQWDKKSFLAASLKFVPRHIPLQKGDTVVSSGYNAQFPAETMIGIVSEVSIEKHMPFYEAKVKLSTDFSSLNEVFVVIDQLKEEKDSLMQL